MKWTLQLRNYDDKGNDYLISPVCYKGNEYFCSLDYDNLTRIPHQTPKTGRWIRIRFHVLGHRIYRRVPGPFYRLLYLRHYFIVYFNFFIYFLYNWYKNIIKYIKLLVSKYKLILRIFL